METSDIADKLLQSLREECPGLQYDYSLAAIKARLVTELEEALAALPSGRGQNAQ